MSTLPSKRSAGCIAALLVIALGAVDAHAQTRRAVVIGINKYTATASEAGTQLRRWKDLQGAVDDALAMSAILESTFAFDEVTVLLDGDASREAIFGTVRTRLVEPTKPGDIVLFYYAGHGSQVVNTASSEVDGLDETIVPADAITGAPDIRDKELRVLFNEILDRGARLTLIFDSCHSGSITRGFPSGETRFIEPAPYTVSDPGEPPLPVDRGALVLSAAQDDELAREILDADALPRGAFTLSLQKALLSSAPGESVQSLFLRTRALMRSKGIVQEPVLSGDSDRRSATLLGDASKETLERDVVMVLGAATAETVVLQAGLAHGIRPGTRLVRVDASGSESGESLVVTEVLGMSRSIAEPLDGAKPPQAGDRLRIRTWVAGNASPLRLHVGPALDHDVLISGTMSIPGVGARMSDPTEVPPVGVVQFDGTWSVRAADGSKHAFGDDLAAALDADGPGRDAFLNLPPFPELRDRLVAGIEASARPVELVESVEAADYVLVGRLHGRETQYAWILRDSAAGSTTSAAPPRSDWRSVAPGALLAADLLVRDVHRLDTVWGWLHLDAPPDDGLFPYRLAGFENVDTGVIRSAGDTLRVGERYRVVLRTSAASLVESQMRAVISNEGRQYVYVFALDRNGNGALLYPGGSVGNGENDFDLFSALPETVVLPERGPLFTVQEPIGVDTFFLLASAEVLPDPTVLNFEGIRTRGPAPADMRGVQRLLYDLGSGTRGEIDVVPVGWSIQAMSVLSVKNDAGRSLPPRE